MDIEMRTRLLHELKTLKQERKSYAERLKLLNDAEQDRLKPKKRNKRTYYYIKRRGDDTYRYLGAANHPEVKRIKQAHLLAAAIKRIDSNIKQITSLLNSYKEITREAIYSDLAEAYGGCNLDEATIYGMYASNWKAEQLVFQKRFEENYHEEKIHNAADGTPVKTISEVAVYNFLLKENLYPVYELPLPLKDRGKPLYPDFTVLSPIDLKTHIIIEYVGMISTGNYATEFAYRVNRYLRNGYKIGVNLFFVFGNHEGHIDTTQLIGIVQAIKGL